MNHNDRLRYYGESNLIDEYEQILRQIALLALAVSAIEEEIGKRGQRLQDRAEQVKNKYN